MADRDSEFPHMSAEAAEHIRAFVEVFVRTERRNRWVSILAMKPKKWVGISAYDCSEPEAADWNTPVADTLERHGLASHLDDRAIVFAIGHSADGPPYEGSLRTALISGDGEIECVVSLVPGRLAVCCGHSNEVRICRR